MGDAVPVLYRRENPTLACPIGARLSKSSMGYMLVVLFPIIGAGLVIWVLVSRRRELAIFQRGQAMEVLVTDIENTQTMANDYPIFKITLERADVRGEPLTLRQWKPKVVSLLQTRMIAKQPVLLLADPRDPTHFLLPETL